MNRLEKAAAFGAMMGKLAASEGHNGVLTNAVGFGGLGGLGGAALGGLAGLTGMVGNEEDEDGSGKPRRGALSRALYGATRGGLLGAGAGALGGAGTAAYQMYNPLTMLKQLHKDRMHAVNRTSPDATEKAKKALIGSDVMLGPVPYTNGVFNTKSMHDFVNRVINGPNAGPGFFQGLATPLNDALNYVGLGSNK